MHFLRITATDPNEQASQYSIETIFAAATGVNNQAHDHEHGAQVLDFDQEEHLMVCVCVCVRAWIAQLGSKLCWVVCVCDRDSVCVYMAPLL